MTFYCNKQIQMFYLPKLVIYLLIFVTSLLVINTAKLLSLVMQLTYCLTNFYYSETSIIHFISIPHSFS